MPDKQARFTFLLEPKLKKAFEKFCAGQDITPSQMMRQMMKAQLALHGTAYPGRGKARDKQTAE